MIEIKRKSQNSAERAEMPLKTGLPQGQGETPTNGETALKGQIKPFQSVDGKQDYRAMFADVYKFHEKFNPPDAADTGEKGGYWWTASEELTQLAGKYPGSEFFTKLLLTVFEELEREYKRIKAEGQCSE